MDADNQKVIVGLVDGGIGAIEVPVAAQTFERLQDIRRMVHDSGCDRDGVAAVCEKRPPHLTGY